VAHIGVGQHATANIMGGYHMRSAEMPAGSVINVRATPVDEGYIPASGIHVLYGSNFTHQDFLDGQQENDSLNRHHFIINESAARILGWKPEEAVGRRMFLGEERSGLVKAVVKDFHFASMREPIGPLVFFNGSWGNIMLVKLSGHNLPQALAFLETKWKKLAPHRPFEYRFLDEDFDKLYQSELRLGRLLNIFTGIAMLLACLGLFGLSSYALQQRSKEIGIRKVLGAGTADVVTLLSKDFVRLVLVSMCIALPVSGWLMHRWLQDFAYRTTLSWWIFGLTALAALAIAFLTVSMQALRTAYANPVKSLRTE
jgi:putative ABC transport system permease protein